jgi:hypothetical protein
VITRDPKTNKRNMGMYRMQVYDGQTTGMHWQRQKVAAEHVRQRLRCAAGAEASGGRRRACLMAADGGRNAESRRRERSFRQIDEDAADGSRGGHRHRSGDDVFGDRARAAGG